MALRACEVLGVPVAEDWRAPLPPELAVARPARLGPANRARWLAARRQDARWAREYAAPWVRRRFGGTSSGDGVPPKRPDLLPVSVSSAQAARRQPVRSARTSSRRASDAAIQGSEHGSAEFSAAVRSLPVSP